MDRSMILNSNVYAVIMAGGIGSKLWPLSRKRIPKQFLHFFDGGTMIRKTVERISRSVRKENIFIITGKHHRRLIGQSLPDFDEGNIIVEPAIRDTATCIALATTFIRKRDPDAVTIVLPADHLVLDEERFLSTIAKGVWLAREKRGLITVGIHPDRPETRYGYIQVEPSVIIEDAPEDGASDSDIALFRVKTFAEKPDIATAEQFLQSRDFWWNSGVFIWHVDDINREYRRSLPDLYEDMQNVHAFIGTDRQESVIEDVYSWIHPVSVAYGIMEKAEKVYMLAGNFGWTDLGCWDEVIKVGLGLEGRDMDGREVIMIDSEEVFVRKPHGKAVVAVGVGNIIVVDTEDALLICKAGESQKVVKAVEMMRRDEKLEGFL
ncbi:MAG: mannose-1-phosphate guanyltransferase [Chlorobiaceae bacterium]|nr:mannose-1-phosphate guanyltransferase [Chlorobiaceae bacterium]